MDTDASEFAIGAELLQVQNGEERCIGYCSFSLDAEQRRYCTRKELLAVVRATRHFRHYLLGRPFIVRTDHSSLQWLLNFKTLNGQLARWLEELSQFFMTIKYRPGSKHQTADALSRLQEESFCPYSNAKVSPDELPCRGCKYCWRMHRTWSEFMENVDYAVPLVENHGQIQTRKVHIGDQVNQATVNPSTTGDKSWLDGYSWDEISRAQHSDKNLKFIVSWLESQEPPSESDLFLSSPESKHYWINKELYALDRHGVLYKEFRTETPTRRLLIIPDSMRSEVLSLCHDIPAAGHQGMDRTLARVREKFHWYAVSSDVRHFIASCAVCNRNKKPVRHARCKMTRYHAGAPMERVHLDFMGPLPVTKGNNAYVLMMVDQFTKWVECIPLPSQTAEETARAAINEFFSRFGYPFQIFTDRGTNFESNLFKQICERLQVHKTRTTPFRPSANGQAEIYNRVLMNSVRCFVSKSPTQWDEYLPQLAGALRSAVNRNTGFTANMLMLGREVNKPIDLVFPIPGDQSDESLDDFVAKLVANIQLAHETARETLKTTQAVMKKDYDIRTYERAYQVGYVVYVLDTSSTKGKCRKMKSPWKGPGVVTRRLIDYVYEIKLRRKLVSINHDRLKLCTDKQLPMWIQRHNATDPSSLTDPVHSNEYCICRGPNTGTFMIQCDECREWYHGACVNVTSSDAKNIDIYLCPECDN